MLTPAQIAKLEELNFRLGKTKYFKIYSRGFTFLKYSVWFDGFTRAEGCVYNERFDKDLLELAKVGIK